MVCNKHAPLCKSRLRNRYNPWITSDIVKSLYERDYIHRRAVNLKSDVLMANYRKLRNKVCHDIDTRQKEYYESQISDNAGNSKVMWKSLRHVLGYNKRGIKGILLHKCLMNIFPMLVIL